MHGACSIRLPASYKAIKEAESPQKQSLDAETNLRIVALILNWFSTLLSASFTDSTLASSFTSLPPCIQNLILNFFSLSLRFLGHFGSVLALSRCSIAFGQAKSGASTAQSTAAAEEAINDNSQTGGVDIGGGGNESSSNNDQNTTSSQSSSVSQSFVEHRSLPFFFGFCDS